MSSSSTSLTTRIIIWIIAITFMVSSLGISLAIIWQSMENRDDTTSQTDQKTLAGSNLENFTPVKEKVEKLQTTDIKAGTGKEVKVGDTITADYTGAFVNTGIVFESSLDSGQPFTAPLKLPTEQDPQGLIAGWVEGLAGMKEGGTRRLVIPAALAYGEQGSASIPPNSDLVFDITVHAIGQ
jgi:FKBP-type peptidyl-prolyl cis-trans isomerase